MDSIIILVLHLFSVCLELVKKHNIFLNTPQEESNNVSQQYLWYKKI